MTKKITPVEINGAAHIVIDENRDGKFESAKGDKLYQDSNKDGRHTKLKDVAMDPHATNASIDKEIEGPLTQLIDGAQISGLQDFFSSVDNITDNPLKTAEDATSLCSQLKRFAEVSRTANISTEQVKKNYGATLVDVIDKALDSFEHISAMDAGKSSMLSFQQYIENLKSSATDFGLPVDWPSFEFGGFNYVNFASAGTTPEEVAVRSAVKSQENSLYKKIRSSFYDLDPATRLAIESGVGKIGISFDADTQGQISNVNLSTNIDFPESFLASVKDIFSGLKLPPLEKPVTVNYPVVFGATQQYLGTVHDKVYLALSSQLKLIRNQLPDDRGFEGVLVLRLDEEGQVLQVSAIPKYERMSEATLPIEKAATRLKFDPVPSLLLQNSDYVQVNCTVKIHPTSSDVIGSVSPMHITPVFATR